MIFIMAVDPAVSSAVRACKKLLDAREAEETARLAKDDALVAVYRAGVPRGRIGRQLRDALTAAGWTAENIARVGVSDGSVESALKAAR